MKILAVKQNRQFSFNGVTRIYALTDTHQDTRKTVSLLSEVLRDNEKSEDILVLHAGDMGKGIYPTNLEIDSYIKLKEARPDIEIVITMGNNDFGFNKKSFSKILQTLKTLTDKGIKIVSANVFNAAGKRINHVYPYTIVKRDGDRSFITGFCTTKLDSQTKGIISQKKQTEVIEELLEAIKREKPDNVIILNHDYMIESQKIVNYCKQRGITVDLVVGGHDHTQLNPDKELHIYYPKAYSESMYKMDLINSNGQKKLKNISQIKSSENMPDKNMIQSVEQYEKQSGLLAPVAKSVLNLSKNYSEPSTFGSFLADNMVKFTNADIGFISTGIIQRPLKYDKGKILSNYEIKSSISGELTLKTAELSVGEIKKIFNNAFKNRRYIPDNSRFLQCSNNIKIIGRNNNFKKCYEIQQIYINGEPQLDNFGQPFDKNKKFKCVFDSYIAKGGQGFNILNETEQKDVLLENKPVRIVEVLIKALKEASLKFQPGSQYPAFKIYTIL